MNTPSNISDLYSDVYKEIKHTIKGEILFKIEEGFVFMNESGNSIKSFNIATGIKSFGLIQLLLNSGAINPKSILIIDEPEVHLHPLWEVEYAKMIVILSTLGIPIIISTHSPYFLWEINTLHLQILAYQYL